MTQSGSNSAGPNGIVEGPDWVVLIGGYSCRQWRWAQSMYLFYEVQFMLIDQAF